VRLAVLLVICTVAGVIAYFLFEKPVDRLLRKRFLKTRATAPEPVR
jgi:peptidoglycan/LPS O-acetylase OafA/YrhL